MSLISQLKSPKDFVKIVDIDWGASDRPVLATVDGCIRVMDMTLKTSESPISHYCCKGKFNFSKDKMEASKPNGI